MTYYMTSKATHQVGYWMECDANTLAGAKREAIKAYGSGYLDTALVISEGDGITEPRRELASKPNAHGAKWVNYDA